MEDKRIAEMIAEAERIERQHQYRPEEKVKWLRVKCPFCGYKFEHSPKPDWDGRLRCPECGKVFKLTRLDDFSQTRLYI
jgi:rubrerythrin